MNGSRVRQTGELVMIVALGVLGLWWAHGYLSGLAVSKALADERAEWQEDVQELLQDQGQRTRADSLELEQVRAELTAERAQALEQIDRAEREETEASARAAEAGADLDATLDSLAVVVAVELRPLVETAQAQHREEQAAEEGVREAFRSQLRGAMALHRADSTALRFLDRQVASERAEKMLALESARLYEEEVGFLRDALPSGLFGHVGSFVKGLGVGVAAGLLVANR